MITNALNWSPNLICLTATSPDAEAIAPDVYQRTCRTDFDQPGFCVLNVGRTIDSIAFRRLMVDLKKAMSAIHESAMGKTLVYLSAARFDQQTSTRPHLDGGPEECFLMLGYEPSEVSAELEISDYTKCAFDIGVSPKEFLAQYNPIFAPGREKLEPYTTRIPCFSPTDFQIICINNSSASYSPDQSQWQGTLHTATILAPDESRRRVINSTMIASVPVGTSEVVNESQQQEFISTSIVHRRGYDKPHLDDDV